MNLIQKSWLILVVMIASFVFITLAVQWFIIMPTYVELEKRKAEKDLYRVLSAIEADLKSLDSLCRDWAIWDQSVEFVNSKGRNQDYIESNLNPTSFVDADINAVFYFDIHGNRVWAELRNENGVLISRPEIILNKKVSHIDPLLRPGTGLINTDIGIVLVATNPVTFSNESPSEGILLLGRLLDLSEITQRTEVEIGMRLEGIQLSEKDKYISTTIFDRYGNPIFDIDVAVGNSITNKGRESLIISSIILTILGIMLAITIQISLANTIIRPIRKLTNYVMNISDNNPKENLDILDSDDEFGQLLREFKALFSRLDISRKQLADAWYRAGRAESASLVLHNVRNSLQPVLVGIAEIQESLSSIPNGEIRKAVHELKTGSNRAEDYWRYLELILAHIEDLKNNHKNELAVLIDELTNVEAILAEQDELSRLYQPLEKVSIAEAIDEAKAVLPNHEFQAEIENLFIEVQRIQFVQIISCLIDNAIEASGPEGQIKCEAFEHNNILHMRIEDNGPGIPKENLDLIFTRGFSTKSERKPRTVGLHWSSNTINMMGGRLYHEPSSKGTVFHLEVPMGGQ